MATSNGDQVLLPRGLTCVAIGSGCKRRAVSGVVAGYPGPALGGFQHYGSRAVFVGQLEKTEANIFIGGIACKTATTSSLFAKMKGLHHGTDSKHQAGVRSGSHASA